MSSFASQYLTADIFNLLSDTAARTGVRAFVIGGYVRDCFLGRHCKDIDVVVEGSGLDFASEVALTIAEARGRKPKVSYFKNFGTAMLRYGDMEVEFVGARKESYNRDSRKPKVEEGTIEDDQRRRDFTINAMAFSLQKEDYGELVDPFGGIRDLAGGVIRTPLEPETTYSDDPLRMLRAIRFATTLSSGNAQFAICEESLDAMSKMSDRMTILSKERIAAEVEKMLMADRPSKAFYLMEKTGLLQYVLPQLLALRGVETVDGKGHKDIFSHTLQVLDHIAADGRDDDLYLRWAALLHDIGKPRCKRFDPIQGWSFHGHEVVGARMVPKIFSELKLPLNEKMKFVQKMVALHHRPIALVDEEVTDSAVRRLLFDAGEDIDELMRLCNADITTKNPAKMERLKHNFTLVCEKMKEVEQKDEIRNFKNPITGEYIMELYSIPPCKTIGVIKEAVKDAILDGVIANDFDSADAFMRNLAAEMCLTAKQ